jgi:hypothetical protein
MKVDFKGPERLSTRTETNGEVKEEKSTAAAQWTAARSYRSWESEGGGEGSGGEGEGEGRGCCERRRGGGEDGEARPDGSPQAANE